MSSRKEKVLLFIVIIQCFALVGTIYVNSRKPTDMYIHETQSEEAGADADDSNETSSENLTIGVHIGGQVKTPGFIWIKEGTRLGEAIEYAGGFLPDADLDAVNLARKLADEEKVYIPKIGETTQWALSAPTNSLSAAGNAQGGIVTGKININTAGISELDTLPGIGEAYASRIIEYRKSKGPFKSIEDIKNVSGIGEKRFEAIKDLITVK